MLSETDKAYFAGILDGEGWFSLQRVVRHRSSNSPTYSASIGVSSTSKSLIDWIQGKVGGTIRVRLPKDGDLGNKIRYEWRAQISVTQTIIPDVLPFLKIKKEQAEVMALLLEMRSSSGKGVRVPKEVIQKRECLYLRLRVLNDTKHAIKSLDDRRRVA